MKITIQKPVGILGEVWLVEIPVSNDVLKSKDPVAGIEAQASVATRVMDNRLLQLNLRLIDHNEIARKLDPEAHLAVRQCVEAMYGTLVGPAQGKFQKEEEGKPAPGDENIARNLEKALEAVDAAK